jgi:hypothetical protein
MKRGRVLPINNCKNCPHSVGYNSTRDYLCAKTYPSTKKIESYPDIPVWCPLPLGIFVENKNNGESES